MANVIYTEMLTMLYRIGVAKALERGPGPGYAVVMERSSIARTVRLASYRRHILKMGRRCS